MWRERPVIGRSLKCGGVRGIVPDVSVQQQKGKDMADITGVVNYTIRVGIPDAIDGELVGDDELHRRGMEIRRELDETGFSGVIQAAAQATVEERFVKYHPIVEVEVGG